MRTLVNSLSHWDAVFAAAIFSLKGKKLIAFVMPWLSHTANGYYNPIVPISLLSVNPLLAKNFLIVGLVAFAIELPLYKLLKNGIKRDRPCENLSDVYRRVSPSDQFSFPSGHQYAFVHDIPMDGANPLSRFVIRRYAPVDSPVGLHWHHFDQTILPPIIPNHFEPNQPTSPNKIIVYLPFETSDDIIALVKDFADYDFYIYHRFKQAADHKNLHLRPYSRAGFLNDLAECNAVICNAGFELVSEALYLGKRVLVKPLAGQMEQVSNALAISSLKLGMVMRELDKFRVAQLLDRPARPPIEFPNVARLIAHWIDSGRWEDVDGLVRKAWSRTKTGLGTNI